MYLHLHCTPGQSSCEEGFRGQGPPGQPIRHSGHAHAVVPPRSLLRRSPHSVKVCLLLSTYRPSDRCGHDHSSPAASAGVGSPLTWLVGSLLVHVLGPWHCPAQVHIDTVVFLGCLGSAAPFSCRALWGFPEASCSLSPQVAAQPLSPAWTRGGTFGVSVVAEEQLRGWKVGRSDGRDARRCTTTGTP